MESSTASLLVSVEDYLRNEADGSLRHEYISGRIYAMRYPTLIVEVLSPSTENTDRREKLLNYPQIPTVDEYVLVARDAREITIQRRAEDWAPQLLTAPDAIAEFRSIKLSLPLTQIYEGAL